MAYARGVITVVNEGTKLPNPQHNGIRVLLWNTDIDSLHYV